MARVSKEKQEAAEAYAEQIAPDLIDICSMCSTTLSNVVAEGEATSQAPQLTVCGYIAEVFNSKHPKAKHVTKKQLSDRIDKWNVDREKCFISDNVEDKPKWQQVKDARISKAERQEGMRYCLLSGSRKREQEMERMAKMKKYTGFSDLTEDEQWEVFAERKIKKAKSDFEFELQWEKEEAAREAKEAFEEAEREKAQKAREEYYDSLSEEEQEAYNERQKRASKERIDRLVEKISFERYQPTDAGQFVDQALTLLTEDQKKGVIDMLYRMFSKMLHPDTNGNDGVAFTKLGEIRETYKENDQ